MRLGIAILRAVIGGLFIGHGLQKLNGMFGGFGLEATAGWIRVDGARAGQGPRDRGRRRRGGRRRAARRGRWRPRRPAALTGTMTVAIDKVHGAKGTWGQNNGYEYTRS